MLVRKFASNGINTKDSPFDLQGLTDVTLYEKGFAVYAENVDCTNDILKPLKSTKIYKNDKQYKKYIYEFKNTILDFDFKTYFLEYKDLLLYSNNSGGFKFDGTNSYTLGIEKPNNIAISLDTGNLSGTYTYAYTYFNSNDGTESQPILSDELNLDNNSVNIDIEASSNNQVDKIRLYRIGNTLIEFTLITTIDNITTSYIDNTSDDNIAGNHILDSQNNRPFPVGAKQLLYSHGIIVSYKDDRLIWSTLGNANYWPASNYLEFEMNITGIGVIPAGLLVFLPNKTYILQGTSPQLFTKFLLSNDQGCKGPDSIGYINNSILWVSNDGICTTNGGTIKIISLPYLEKQNLDFITNAIIDSKYYLLLANGKILVADFRFGEMFYYINIPNIENIQTVKTNDTLLIYKSDKYIYKLNGDENLQFTYLSPKYTDNILSRLKYYHQIYIAYKGNLHIKIYINNNLVLETDITKNIIKLPAIKQRGYWIQFEISGTGEVYELSYKVTKENYEQ